MNKKDCKIFYSYFLILPLTWYLKSIINVYSHQFTLYIISVMMNTLINIDLKTLYIGRSL